MSLLQITPKIFPGPTTALSWPKTFEVSEDDLKTCEDFRRCHWISVDDSKTSEDFRRRPEYCRRFPNITRKVRTISENCRGLHPANFAFYVINKLSHVFTKKISVKFLKTRVNLLKRLLYLKYQLRFWTRSDRLKRYTQQNSVACRRYFLNQIEKLIKAM